MSNRHQSHHLRLLVWGAGALLWLGSSLASAHPVEAGHEHQTQGPSSRPSTGEVIPVTSAPPEVAAPSDEATGLVAATPADDEPAPPSLVLGGPADPDADPHFETSASAEVSTQSDASFTLTPDEIIAQTGANAVRWDPPPAPRYMSPEGVEDPFPDRVKRARPRDAAILLGLGAGFAAASVITARLTLLPDCENQSDLTTCAVPNRAEIGLRSGRLFGTIGFSIGSAAFGAFGARELGQILQQGGRGSVERRRRLALGLGSGSVVAGLTGLVVGSSLMGLGTRRSLRLASTFDSSTAVTDPETAARINETLDQIKVARVGLMVMVASPVLIATGISLLVHRPRRERLTFTPTVSPTNVGLSATVRF